MVDTHFVDLLALCQADTPLKKVSSREYAGPCIFCGGKDRFRVWPEKGRWWCRQEDKGGDVLEYVMRRDGINFPAACEMLGISRGRASVRKTPSRRANAAAPTLLEAEFKNPPDTAWQQGAHQFCTHCEALLWSDAGKPGQAYLASRGLTDERVIAAAGLGYNPRTYRAYWGEHLITLPPGIVIPWLIRGVYWNVNVRNRSDKGTKYLRAAGGVNSIYGAQYVQMGCTVVMVESEFDALVIRQALFDFNLPVVPVATGSISWGRPLQWLMNIAIAGQARVAFDLESDVKKLQAVEAAALWWLEKLGPKARRLLPTRYDVNAMLKAGEDIREWIVSASGVRPIPVSGPASSEEMLAAGWTQRPLFVRSKKD